MKSFLALAAIHLGIAAARVRHFAGETKADLARLDRWVRKAGPFYFGSAFAHLLIVGLVLSWTFNQKEKATVTAEPQIDTEIKDEVIEFQLFTSPVLPSTLSAETIAKFQQPSQTKKHFDEQAVFEDAGGGTQSLATQPLFGGLGGFKLTRDDDGPRAFGDGGVGIGLGSSLRAGNGGQQAGLEGAGRGQRDEVDGPLDDQADRAVAAALNWFHRHQHPDGHWSLSKFGNCSAESPCSGPGHVDADVAATALALLPFLAAGQTHTQQGFYQQSVARGLDWLVEHQAAGGDLAGEANPIMYSQALATLALCEDFAKTGDERIGAAAQRAVRFIEATQNPTTGGWHFQPDDLGDTAHTAWQVMALHSAQLAGLDVNAECLRHAERWFNSVSHGQHGGLIGHLPNTPPTISMTALGLLSRQYLGARRSEPFMAEGLSVLHAVSPDENSLSDDLFRTFCVAQALHAFDPLSAQWDSWNLHARRALLATQEKAGCAAGSWYPEQSGEIWTLRGGRLLATSLATLTLAVSYREPLQIRDQFWLLVRRPEPLERQPQRPAAEVARPQPKPQHK